MNTQPDFQELLRLLEKNSVRYMVVGGYAVAFHGYPRFTQDMDIFFKNSRENVIQLKQALVEFEIPENELSDNIFLEKGNILRFGVSPSRIDLINEIDGVSYVDAEANLVRGKYGDTEINFIGKNELIKNKLATGRLKDQADVQELQ